MNQSHIYTYPLPLGLPSHSGHHSALSSVLCAIEYIAISCLFYLDYRDGFMSVNWKIDQICAVYGTSDMQP